MIRYDTIHKNLRRTKTIMDNIKDRKISIFVHLCKMKDLRLIDSDDGKIRWHVKKRNTKEKMQFQYS